MKSRNGIAANCRRLLALSALALALTPVLGETARAELPSQELVKALQSGGYVVYMRHTKTEKNQEDLDHTNLANCATQRNLSEEGREQARVIAKAFKKLGIRTQSVLTSPYCRAKETATIAFGGAQIDNVLRYLSHIPDAERPAAGERSVGLLGTAPHSGPRTPASCTSSSRSAMAPISIWARSIPASGPNWRDSMPRRRATRPASGSSAGNPPVIRPVGLTRPGRPDRSGGGC